MVAKKETKNVKEKTKKDLINEKLDSILNSDEFRNKYVIPISRNKRTNEIKEAILADGLKVLANVKGIKRLTTEIIQFPSNENHNTCIVQTHLIGYDISPINDEMIEVEYSAIGDASPDNCGAMVAKHFIRMAETRSVSRVFRAYTNVAMVAFEELGEKENDEKHNNNVAHNNGFNSNSDAIINDAIDNMLASQAQKNKLNELLTTKNLKINDLKEEIARELNITDFKALTRGQANNLITYLSNK